MTDRLDPQALAAFADGELTPAETAGVAERLLRDREAAARLRALQSDRALLQAAYRDAAEAPLPAGLLAAIDRGFDKRRASSRRMAPHLALAAALALLLAGGLAGYLAGEYRLRSELEAIAARDAEDQRLLAEAVHRALESAPSGQAVAWHNPDSGVHGEVVPVRTYRSKSNHWCREYRASKVANGSEEKIRAIACRSAEGAWVKVEDLYFNS